MMNGIINVYKEKGYTSHDVVAKLRGILKQKKIGHTGTLDPQAEGVLPVCIGNATKLCDLLTDKTKEYEAVLLLGVTTDTQDTTGAVLSEKTVQVEADKLRTIMEGFIGKSQQIPPMYSALKVNGKKLYELAREGKEVERKPRDIEIFSLEILEMQLPRVRFRVHCSKGTYIRTLCQDIGEKAGCGGCMEALLRTRVDRFSLTEAHKLSEIEQIRDADKLSEILIPVDQMFLSYPKVTAPAKYQLALANGNSFTAQMLAGAEDVTAQIHDGALVRVYSAEDVFYGIYQYTRAEERFIPYKMFLPQ
ncbi:tRNA pseudouridine(55) synthase TruB [Kineothrix sp. MSJ-39]|uniref:tRNA pseudouridine(55) synthase TruB n=1 Tax=Kineothrix sp. MSJ-39 TaxID=2841533 RepID=UPI001C124144|nr:tRNA pseudouridine(55) synthase TruB [Kineothrix sp. MSJ-39]MBU5429271.1 tRNA pseudouridine(55) synthase TruB [Kineothrix sp. MSJ-39]